MDLKENISHHLVELGGSNFEIADGEPDITGWDVENNEGQKIGEVDELLFDPESRKVRYLIVDLTENDLSIPEGKKVLIPIGIAELHPGTADYTNDAERGIAPGIAGEYSGNDNDNDIPSNNAATNVGSVTEDADMDDSDEEELVIVPVSLEQLNELPAYEQSKLTADVEATIRRIFEKSETSSASYGRDDFYGHEHFNEDKFYGRTVSDTESIPDIDEKLGNENRETGTAGMKTISRIVERPLK